MKRRMGRVLGPALGALIGAASLVGLASTPAGATTWTPTSVASGLDNPSVAVDPAGNVFVVSRDNGGQIVEYPASGGSAVNVETDVSYSQGGIAVDAGDDIFAVVGGELEEIPSSGAGTWGSAVDVADVGTPANIAVDGDDNLYVASADWTPSDVAVYPSTGDETWGSPLGLDPGTDAVYAVAVEPTTDSLADGGNVYLVSEQTSDVYQFTYSGSGSWSGEVIATSDGNSFALAARVVGDIPTVVSMNDSSSEILEQTYSGSAWSSEEVGGLSDVNSLAIGSGGDVYAATSGDSDAVVEAYSSRLAQTVVFTSRTPSEAAYGGTYVPTATGGASGNAVTFSVDPSSTSGACSYSAATGAVTFTWAGTCVIDADQAGNAGYFAATEVQQSISIAAAVPSAPTAVDAVTTSDGLVGAGGLSWTAPSSDGGSAITGYEVTADDLTTAASSSARVAGTSATIDALQAGDAYDFSVVAVNSIGGSTAATSDSVVPVRTTPTATSSATSTSSTATVTAGGAASGEASLGASATGEGKIVVSQYGSDPVAQLQSSAGSMFYDVATTPGSSFSSIAVTICGIPSGGTVDWWDPIGQDLVAPSMESAPSGGCVTVTIDSSTTPSLSDLYGTVFVAEAAAVPPASAPAAAGASAGPRTTAASKIAVTTSGHRVFGRLVTYTADVADAGTASRCPCA